MNEVKLIILILLTTANTMAQDWYNQINDQAKLIVRIQTHDSWESVYKFGQDDLKISEESLLDIAEAIAFRTQPNLNAVDTFFHLICDSVYTSFPYRQSGHLSKQLHSIPLADTSRIRIPIRGTGGKDLHAEVAKILQTDEDILLPQLMQYLKNDAATRLCVRPVDWDEPPFYLSISDVAMEIIEIKTLCDFFDNASHSHKLYSNLTKEERNFIVNNIQQWYTRTNLISGSDKIVFFLDSICPPGHSYSYTCHNLLFSGDTTTAQKMYKKLYNAGSMPCRKDWETGKILLALGDRTVITDCMNTSINYRCMDDSGKACVTILLESREAYYRDELFAEIISTEPNSAFRKSGTGPGYVWHKIFNEIADYEMYQLPKTLVALMSMTMNFNEVPTSFYKWKEKYPEEILSTYRICDLALLKYNETIEAVDIANWNDIQERNEAIKLIQLKYAE